MRFGRDRDTPPALRVLNLGAGVQSSTVLLMAVEGELPKPDLAIFADTGWEPAAVYEWLAELEGLASEAGITVERVSAGDIRADVIGVLGVGKVGSVGQPPFYVRGKLDTGKEGRLWRKCTRDYKIDPIRQRIRELLGASKGQRVSAGAWVEQWYGISLDEVGRVRDPRDPWAVNYYPLIEKRMTRAGCLAWMEAHGYARPPRSACIGCPFHNDGEWRRMRDEDPEAWEDAVDFDRQIRTGIPGVAGRAYLHRSTVPLDEVDLATPEDRGQVNLFNSECEGMCGV